MAENIPLSSGLKVSIATSEEMRGAAGNLLARRYASKGYGYAGLPESSGVSIAVSRDDEVAGTLTIGFEKEGRLLADDLFPDELAAYRRKGHKLCEFTKLAIENVVEQKSTIGALFHVGCIVSCINKVDKIIIEVHPRHSTFYRRLLGFTLVADGRHNQRVNAPASLLSLDLCYVYEMIADVRCGLNVRLLYTHFLPEQDSKKVYAAIRRGPAEIPASIL